MNRNTLNKENMHSFKVNNQGMQVRDLRQDTYERPPPQGPVPTQARTFCGTVWTFAEDCGTAPPDLETPEIKRVQRKRFSKEKEKKTDKQSKSKQVEVSYNDLFTSNSSRCDRCLALASLMQFPALVTNTTGTLYFPFRSTRFLKHCLAAGIGVVPRTSTPSMSKRSPKELGPFG